VAVGLAGDDEMQVVRKAERVGEARGEVEEAGNCINQMAEAPAHRGANYLAKGTQEVGGEIGEEAAGEGATERIKRYF
jgi:hypothetical protein